VTSTKKIYKISYTLEKRGEIVKKKEKDIGVMTKL
jgi:hypothetical protein